MGHIWFSGPRLGEGMAIQKTTGYDCCLWNVPCLAGLSVRAISTGSVTHPSIVHYHCLGQLHHDLIIHVRGLLASHIYSLAAGATFLEPLLTTTTARVLKMSEIYSHSWLMGLLAVFDVVWFLFHSSPWSDGVLCVSHKDARHSAPSLVMSARSYCRRRPWSQALWIRSSAELLAQGSETSLLLSQQKPVRHTCLSFQAAAVAS